MRQVYPIAVDSGMSISSANYLPVMANPPGGSVGASISEAKNIVTAAGTIDNLVVNVPTAPGTGKGWTITMYLNGSASALTCSVTDSSTQARDTLHSVAVVAGDEVAYVVTPSGSPASSVFHICTEFEGSTTAQSQYSMAPQASGNSTNRQGLFTGTGSGWTTNAGSTVANVVAAAGNVTGVSLQLSFDLAGVEAVVFYIYKEPAAGGGFVKQDGTGGTVNTGITFAAGEGLATKSASFTLPVAAGDKFFWERATTGGSPFPFRVYTGVKFVATTDGQSQFCGYSPTAPANSAARYQHVFGATSDAWSSTESDDYQYIGASSWILKKLYVYQHGAPGSGKSYTYDLRKNGASPSGTTSATVADSATAGNDATSNQVSVVDGDRIDLRSTPTGTPTANALSWGLILTVSAPVLRGSFVAGSSTTVTATRAAAFGLDGNTNTHSEAGKLKVFGDFEVTGAVTFSGSYTVRQKTIEVSLTSPELLALRATPKTLVAAPGAGQLLEFAGAVLLLDATATAYVESSANLSVKYTNGSGAKASEDIEATGFIDQTTDTMTTARPRLDQIIAKSGCENQPLVLHNIGAGEYTTGTGTMRVKVSYRTWTTGW